MSDLISREALGNKLSTLYEYYLKTRYLTPDGAVWDCIKLLCDAPTVDAVEVVHGRWIKPTVIDGRAFNIPHCSICNGVPCGVDEHTNYCPNCGAKMDEVSE